MKEIDNYIIEKLKINKDSKPVDYNNNIKIVDRIFAYQTARKELIIDYILQNFAEKCAYLLRDNPNLNSLETYDIFKEKFYSDNDDNRDGYKLIYHEIPNLYNDFTSIFQNSRIKRQSVEEMFGPGEFPIVYIYAKLAKKTGEFSQVFYTIDR